MTITTSRPQEAPVRVLQITDTHLFADGGGTLLGLNTDRSLAAVIEHAGRQAAADLVIATGDIAHEASPAAYQRFFDHVQTLGAPTYCLPGNHDEGATLQALAGNGQCRYVEQAEHGAWQFVFVDSTVAGSEGSHMDNARLDQLDRLLATSGCAHALVCLHHQPVPMDSHWLDTMAMDNPADFFAVLDRHPQVRGVIWGHVHQELDTTRGDVRLLATPSTCIQFEPRSSRFALDDRAPGYRWLELHHDGNIVSGVERLAEIPGTVDAAAGGY